MCDFPRHQPTSLPQIRSQISQFKIEIEIFRDIQDGLLSAYSQILSLYLLVLSVHLLVVSWILNILDIQTLYLICPG